MSTAQDWTNEKKEQWFFAHPCKKKNVIWTTHRKGRCVNCGGCITCEKPPWCPLHKKKPNTRTHHEKPQLLDDYLTPAKRSCRNKETIIGTFVSPLGMVKIDDKVEELLDQCDMQADEDKAEGNWLGNRFSHALNKIQFLPSTPKKASKLATVVEEIMKHLADGNEERYEQLSTAIVQRLDPDTKHKDKLCKNIATLIIDGSVNSRRVASSLLLSSCSDTVARKIMNDSNYAERRKEQTFQRKVVLNEGRKRAAQRAGVEPNLTNMEPGREFTTPLSRSKSNAVHRRNFVDFLSKGKDIPSLKKKRNKSLPNTTDISTTNAEEREEQGQEAEEEEVGGKNQPPHQHSS